ncbi:MAG: DUF4428 domain-containing protein [Firmicutes bacterium]|nr:DUF4428 domain-containing protein [Bacillota bacterium]
MGLFDKKFCDVCGEKIGMLGNRKLEDGNLCKDCAKKLSPWFDDRRHSTLEEIKSQLQMREENRSLVSSFHPGRVIRSDRYNLYIDERQQLFAASVNLDREDNPDIISLSQITGCNLDVNEMRTEEYRTDRDGERESYNPPRYSYSYDYYFYIYLNHPYINEMKLKLNSMDISEDDRNRRHDVERAGQEMMSYLQNVTGCTVGGMGMNQGMGMQSGMGMNQGMGMQSGMGMNQGMGMQPGMGMNNQGMGMQPAAGMNQGMSQNVNAQGGMGTAAGGMGAAAGAAAGAAFAGNAAEGPWVCQSCGATNAGRFCESCGSPRK